MRQKQNIRRLNAISKIFDLEKFYSITLNGTVQLQGEFNQTIVMKATENKFKVGANMWGHITLDRPHYHIVLT